MLAWRLKDVKTGEKVGSFPDRLLLESAVSVDGEGGTGKDPVLVAAAAAPAVRLADRPKDASCRERKGAVSEVDLYRAPASAGRHQHPTLSESAHTYMIKSRYRSHLPTRVQAGELCHILRMHHPTIRHRLSKAMVQG